jgi:hypothetical protein
VTSSRHHRRRFLKTAAGAFASTVAAPYVLTGVNVRAATANQRLGVAAIGVGPRGAAVSRQAGNLGDMVAVCDVSQNAAARFAQEYDGKPETCGDYRQVWNARTSTW